jgi:hypothetical protein
MLLGVLSMEGLGVYSAGGRKTPRRNKLRCWDVVSCGKVECGAGEGRYRNGAQCPRVRLVLGDVIDIGEPACACIPFQRLR